MAPRTSQNQFSPNTPGAAHLHFLHSVRAYEMDLAMRDFPPPFLNGRQCKVLEVGAGTGQQAKRLSEAGYDVTAIDVESSRYREARVFDVVEYDGVSIPAEDHAFDVVFSSNVLEHVSNIDAFLDEALRVLAIDGIAIHVLPTTATRFWSIPAHYIWLMKRLFARFFSAKSHEGGAPIQPKPRTPADAHEWIGTLFPLRHGERGNTFTEMFYFARWWWAKTFQEHGFNIVEVKPNHLFYTLANSMTDSISLHLRKRLAGVLGSACAIYVLKRA